MCENFVLALLGRRRSCQKGLHPYLLPTERFVVRRCRTLFISSGHGPVRCLDYRYRYQQQGYFKTTTGTFDTAQQSTSVVESRYRCHSYDNLVGSSFCKTFQNSDFVMRCITCSVLYKLNKMAFFDSKKTRTKL